MQNKITKENKVMKKIFISIIAGLVILLGLMPAGVAFAADTTTGSFTVGSVSPNMTTMEIYSDTGLTLIASTLTPQVEYYKKISVSDANTLNDITELKMKMYYDADGTDPLESTVVAGNTQTAAIITWTKAGSVWAIDAGAGTSWSIVTADCVVPTLTASSGDWVVAFKIGKVATESLAPANWDFWGQVKNTAGVVTGTYKRNKMVQWYGEIAVNTPNVNWGVVTPGTGFADNVNEQTGISATWVSNGNYSGKIKSSATWAGSLNTATLDATGNTMNPKEFSLKAWHDNTYASAVLVDSVGVVINATGVQTIEAGDIHTANTLWLKLASVFPIDVYSGTITYIIANR